MIYIGNDRRAGIAYDGEAAFPSLTALVLDSRATYRCSQRIITSEEMELLLEVNPLTNRSVHKPGVSVPYSSESHFPVISVSLFIERDLAAESPRIWDGFIDVLRDPPNLDVIVDSNHVLQALWLRQLHAVSPMLWIICLAGMFIKPLGLDKDYGESGDVRFQRYFFGLAFGLSPQHGL